MKKEIVAAGRRILPLYKDVDGVAKRSTLPMSCRRGCSHCCYNLAAVSLVEAVPIAEYLLTSPIWSPRLSELRQKMMEQADLVDQLGGLGDGSTSVTSDKYFKAQKPCVFLKKNNDCGIYNIRPVTCRTYFVVTPPKDCSLDNPGGEVGVIDFGSTILEFWVRSMGTEAKNVPQIVDSLPRVVLLALELLETGTIQNLEKYNTLNLDVLIGG